MDLKELGKTIASIGLPIIGTALGGPGGALIAKMVAGAIGLDANASPADIATAVSGNPDAIAKLQELHDRHEEFMTKAAYDAEVAARQAEAAQVESVNKTLQTEAMGGSWLQRNHHAIESLTCTYLVGAIYFVLPLFKLPVPTVPEFAFVMLGSILGVTAWQRGQANNAIAKGA